MKNKLRQLPKSEMKQVVTAKRKLRKIATKIKNPQLVQQRHNQIFEAAVKLFAVKGYHKTTLRELSKASRLGLGNIYDYIGNKNDILFILYRRIAEIIFEQMDNVDSTLNPLERLRTMIEKELTVIDRYQNLVMIVYQESHAMDALSMKSMLSTEAAHINRYGNVLEEGIKSGIFVQCNPAAVANIIKIMIDSWVLKRWNLRGNVSLTEMKKAIDQFIYGGIVNDNCLQKLEE